MRIVLAAVLVVAAATTVLAGDDLVGPIEVGLTGGISTAPGSGRDPSSGLSVAFGFERFRITGGASYTRLHKYGTPGGFSANGRAGAELFLGRFLLTGGMSTTFVDQTVWTKRVRYAYGGVGFRWAGTTRKRGVPLALSDFRLLYWRETFSTYANETHVIEGVYRFDRRLGTGPWCVRLNVAIGGMYFNDNPYPGAARRQGATANFGIGLAYRP